jgi:hypothetical protein
MAHEFNPKLGAGWTNIPLVTDEGDVETHRIPINDLYRHHLKADECNCCPREVEFDYFIHNAWDQREDYEAGVRAPN